MPLKSHAKKLIEIILEDLQKRVKDHESGEIILFHVAYEDYKNDIEILRDFLQGKEG